MKKSGFPGSPTARAVIERVFAEDIPSIRLCFLGSLGRLIGQNISRNRIWDVLERGNQGFDGLFIEGFVRIQESDKIALPMQETSPLLPYLVDGQKVGVM